MLYDWLKPHLTTLNADLARGSYALLLSGIQGIGKRQLAEHAAWMRLCDAPTTDGYCGQCASCQLLLAGTHPDLIVLQPSEEETPADNQEPSGTKTKASQYIVIDQIRRMLTRVELVSHAGKGRVILIDPADRLNDSAANALLKTLEEPPAQTVFLLISAHEERLPVTVRSRCRRVPVPRPSNGAGLSWLLSRQTVDAENLLRLAGGAPVLAAAMGEGGFSVRWNRLAERLNGRTGADTDWDTSPTGLGELCHLMQLLCIDLLRTRNGGQTIYSEANAAVIHRTASLLSAAALSDFWMMLVRMRGMIHHPLNGALVRDQLLLAFDRMLNEPGGAG